MLQREQSAQAKLARSGFQNSAQALRLLADPLLQSVDQDWLLENLCCTADPDLALLGYLRLSEAIAAAGETAQNLLARICATESSAKALFAILGYSTALSEFLISHPLDIEIFSSENLDNSALTTNAAQERALMREVIFKFLPSSSLADFALQENADGVNLLRRYYWQRITQIAAIDLCKSDPVADFAQIAAAITRLIDTVLDGALLLARAIVPKAELVNLAIIAMGKTGAQEINYISDVDLIYLVAPARESGLSNESELVQIGTELAMQIASIVSVPGRIAPLWEIDANLRPEGKDGPLVRTLDSYLNYYRRWAKGWEFQALLKARPVAGDLTLGGQLVAQVQDLIWAVAGKESFVEESQAMRRRVLDLVPAAKAPRQLKLGKGGLREIEFTVQLLQLVHGRTDLSLRVRATLEALVVLSAGGYISRTHASQLAQYYRFLRTLEHRIQLFRFRRSQLVPNAPQELRRIARSLKGSIPEIRNGEDLEYYWQKIRANVRALHLEIYYRPLIPAVAKLSANEVALEPFAAQARLAAIGYRDPRGALAHIKALTSGISRTALIQRHLLPVLIGWFGEGADPDQGLRSFRIISEQMGATPWYMRTLRDSSVAAERLAKILSCSKYIAQQLPKLSEAISWLDDDALLIARSPQELQDELAALVSRRSTPNEIATAGRYLRRKELLRTALAQLLGISSEREVQNSICAAADIAIEAALRAATEKICADYQLSELPFEFAVIALGRFGGKELSYASDVDLIFVHRPCEMESAGSNLAQNILCAHNWQDKNFDLDGLAIEFARAVITFLSGASAEPELKVDTALRPEGKNGPLCRSFESYRQYYARWVELWERQALLRARFCAGAQELGTDFLELINPLRYPKSGLTQQEIRTIRTMKVRIENERIPRGLDPLRHLKLGPGGLSDIEWTAQYLQLLYAGETLALRTSSTLAALCAAKESGFLSAADYNTLTATWIFASKLRDANFLGTGRVQASKVDLLPIDLNDFAAVAAIAGYLPENRKDLDDDYLRLARKSRVIVERIFYGDDDAK